MKLVVVGLLVLCAVQVYSFSGEDKFIKKYAMMKVGIKTLVRANVETLSLVAVTMKKKKSVMPYMCRYVVIISY